MSKPATSAISLSRRAEMVGGQPISYLMHQALAYPDLISLAAGFVDPQTLPDEVTREALDFLLSDQSRARAALQYGTTPGLLPLREAVLERSLQADGASKGVADVSVEQVIVTAGSNQLLHLACDTILDPGDIVICASPSYFVFLGTIANLGAISVGVEADEHGLVPEALEAELKRLKAEGQLPRVKAIYCTSYFDNPCSVSLSLARRPRIVEIAKQWSSSVRILVIEDTAYRELRYVGEDLPSISSFDEEGDTVIGAGTFSKSFSPGIRVGWGVLPKELVEPVCQQKSNIDFGSPNFSQHLMHTILERGLFDRHLVDLRHSYRVKMDAMLTAAEQFLGPIPEVDWIRPSGGLYVWVTLPESIEAGPGSPLHETALAAGVLYVPGEYCFPANGRVKKNTLRLSFGVQPVEGIQKGMQALSQAIETATG